MLLCLPMACACATGAGCLLRLALLALTCLLSCCCMAWPHPCIYGTWLRLSSLLVGMLSPRSINVDIVRARVARQYAATYPDQVTALVLVDGATNQFSLRPGWSREQAIKDLAPPRFAGTPRDTFLAYYRSGPLGQQWTPELEESILHI